MATTAADQTIWIVPLEGGGTSKGTQQELDARFSGADWRSVARQAQVSRPPQETTRDAEDKLYDTRLSSSARTYNKPAQRSTAPGIPAGLKNGDSFVRDGVRYVILQGHITK